MVYNWIPKEKPHPKRPGPPPATWKIHNQNLLVLLVLLLSSSSPHAKAGSAGKHVANIYLAAKIGFDITENEPFKVC